MSVSMLRYHHRYREIAGVVSHHGLWWLIQQFGLDRVPVLGRLGFRRGRENGVSQAQHLRLALEELGPTFIKLGQILSMRDDLLPPEYIEELILLRENAPPVDADAIVAVITEELELEIERLYETFDRVPLASASIGQVHAATLSGGRQVVVKVQKPGVPEQINEDLQVFQQLAAFAQRHSPLAEQYDLVDLAEEFSWTLRNELDYLREGRNADTFRADFANSRDVIIPEVLWDLTTTRVLTMERIDGLRINDLAALDAAGIDRKELAGRASRIILDEVFVYRFFHADPHPGNFAVQPDGRIAAYDFGMVGRLSARVSRQLMSLLWAATREDPERIIDAAIGLDIIHGRFDRPALTRDIERLIGRYARMSVGEIDIEVVFRDITGLIREHRLRLPGDLALLMKTLGMHEATAKRLDPDFTPVKVAAPYARRAVFGRYQPAELGTRLLSGAEDAFELLLEAPRRLDRLINILESGNFETAIRVIDAEKYTRDLQALVNRLVVAWLIGTSLISLSVLLAIYRPSSVEAWLGPLFWIGAAVTVAAGGILFLILMRRRR
ncbi:MAG TPA: AarF/ABC1/UbiB kinase family protein [Thermomicrobiales bacterium]|nr:AarF/ABC1/UbiB kinase family protein [Thermomicrobiales bacterium]HQZ88626.1 AarF/ABC1/UbiB kinase family protein [Thermomicrobiales bacterium]HRA30922.1 AarF/ABC1/UbiB kinase family protein [Thermomicrobiales bacterium]